MKKTRLIPGAGLVLAGLLAVTSWTPAAADSRGASRGGFLASMDRVVGLTPEQRDAARGLLAEQRQAVRALHDQTDGKIRALLTPEQQKKFDAFVASWQSQRASAKSGAGV